MKTTNPDFDLTAHCRVRTSHLTAATLTKLAPSLGPDGLTARNPQVPHSLSSSNASADQGRLTADHRHVNLLAPTCTKLHQLAGKKIAAGICILAGGLSRRMGRDKGRMRLARRTLLGHVRHTAEASGLEVRVIRKDLVARCGPLGGIYTGLKTSAHEAEIFLSCDMPFVTPTLLSRIMRSKPPAFVEQNGRVGFPFILRVADLDVVEREIRAGRFSLQNLASRLKARRVRLSGWQARQLFNVNTPADWQEAQRRASELPCK